MKEFARDFATFRRMTTPLLIIGIYWGGTALIILFRIALACIGMWVIFARGILEGLAVITLSFFCTIMTAVLHRVWCESVILYFRINETLTDIRGRLDHISVSPTS